MSEKTYGPKPKKKGLIFKKETKQDKIKKMLGSKLIGFRESGDEIEVFADGVSSSEQEKIKKILDGE